MAQVRKKWWDLRHQIVSAVDLRRRSGGFFRTCAKRLFDCHLEEAQTDVLLADADVNFVADHARGAAEA